MSLRNHGKLSRKLWDVQKIYTIDRICINDAVIISDPQTMVNKLYSYSANIGQNLAEGFEHFDHFMVQIHLYK